MKAFKLAFLLLLFSCEQWEPCSEDFVDHYDRIQEAFSLLYTTIPEKNAREDFKTSLVQFKEKHLGIMCSHREKNIDPWEEVDKMLNELEGGALISTKAIYGQDDRYEVEDVKDQFKTLAKSTLAQIDKSELDKDFNILSTTIGEGLDLCPNEKFYDQFMTASCTGFLVSPRMVITAGHCMQIGDCKNKYWVFDFIKDKTQFDPDSVYKCSKVIRRVEDDANRMDYALIELDRDVIDRKFLQMRSHGKIQMGESLVIAGHPSGIPLKVASNASVIANDDKDHFYTNLDTFSGNSGSPIF